MPLVATRGAASSQGFGEFAQTTAPVYIEDVMSTYLYTGTGSDQTLTTGIDLSTYGGMIWSKRRSAVENHFLQDTNRGLASRISSNTTGAAATTGAWPMNAISTTGMTVSGVNYAAGGETYVSWTFRKQPKFFDVVTYTGNGVAGSTIAHNLGSVPGCIIVKRTDSTSNWPVYHRSISSPLNVVYLNLTTAASQDSGPFHTTPTASVFYVGDSTTNASGGTYVAYLFAHNAGGFGLTGTDNVISCGSWAGDTTVNLGYEPQWVLVKRTDAVDNWYLIDTMRGLTVNTSPAQTKLLIANSTAAENTSDYLAINATGFTGTFTAGNYIYIAIRRGPMKTPTTGTSVFTPVSNTSPTTGNLTDLTINRQPTDLQSTWAISRLTNAGLETQSTNAETSTSAFVKFDVMTGVTNSGWLTNSNSIWWNFRRAPGFFDVVCYTGTGSARTVSHNLGVAPELMIIKNRSSVNAWNVNAVVLGTSGNVLNLATSAAAVTSSSAYNSTAPTSSVFTVGTAGGTNSSGETYVAYLFASVSGVSKVGSYTGTGTTLQVNCGFTNGARFVLIKRTNSTGDWYVWDSARGIVAGNDPYLLLNSTAAEVTNTDYVDTYSAGFEISSTAPTAINANGSTFIFLAIA